ncbi:MAG: SAM-dependent methyltransferase [Myxococcales bacterium]
MKARTVWSLAADGRLGLLRELGPLATPYYRACFAVAAARSGLLRALAGGPRTIAEIAAALSIDAAEAPALAVWLEVGAGAGILRRRGAAYALSRASHALAAPHGDGLLAFLEEMLDLHRRLILEAPERLARGRRFALVDHDAAVVARSSRLLEPFIVEAVDDFVPRRGPLRLLEIGCGAGALLKAAAARNPALEAVGLDLSEAVADMARKNLRDWGLAARATVEVGDVHTWKASGRFDLATLHQNIYYFPEAEHVPLLARVRSLLVPGGRLLLTTACRGGSPAMAVLSLWGAITEGCSALPDPKELNRKLRSAGFREVRRKNLLAPLDSFYAFYARAP